MKVTEFAFEAMLVRWAETSNGGATIVLQLADVGDLEIFKSMTLKSGNRAGQRLAIGAALIGDDEKKVPIDVPDKKTEASPLRAMAAFANAASAKAERVPSKSHIPGGFCGLAVKWCDDVLFREWLAMEFQSVWESTAQMVRLINKTADIERAAHAIKIICGVTSRKDLDKEPARSKFEERIRAPYMTYLKEGE